MLVYHTASGSSFDSVSSLGLFTVRLNLGVSVFFLISGFLLYRPFAVAHFSGRGPLSPARFWVRRLLRIVPAYWLALTVVTYAMHSDTIGSSWRSIIVDYGFAQIYYPLHFFSGIGQAWSLCTEMSFYLFLPLYAALIGMRRRSPAGQLRREVLALGVFVAIGVGFKDWVLNYHCAPHCFTSHVPYMISWLPSFLDLFALGMFLAVMSAWYTQHRSEPTWIAHPAMPWASWACAAIVYVAVTRVGNPIAGALSPTSYLVSQELYGLFAFFLLLPAVFGPQDHGLIRRLLSAWPVAALGVVSYGVYLWHKAWFDQVYGWFGAKGWASLLSYVALTLLVLVLSTASASASYFVVERPLLRLKDGFGSRRRPLRATPTPVPTEPPAPAPSLTSP